MLSSWWKPYTAALCLSFAIDATQALDNGVALTPPMGWMTWQRFRCITDCEKYPNQCISERLVKRTADLMVANGYLDAGYKYLIVDDCWPSRFRTEDGDLQADPIRFPNGMKAVIDYVHSKGLKFGIYEDYGEETCGGYPGLYGHERRDIELLVDWGIDYIKVDGCNSLNFTTRDFELGYEYLKDLLNETGRPVVFSCSYPAYVDNPDELDFHMLTENCNLWRYYGDIDDSWDTVKDIADHAAETQEIFAKHGGVGHWNDPDMLIIGNYGLSYEESKTQMALWAIMAAPLLMSTDLATVRPEHRAILQNKRIIKINQDRLGIQGGRAYSAEDYEVWTRKVEPVVHGYHSFAIALCSRRTDGAPYEFTTTLGEFGLYCQNGYKIEDLYTGLHWPKILKPGSSMNVRIPPSGVVFLKATPLC